MGWEGRGPFPRAERKDPLATQVRKITEIELLLLEEIGDQKGTWAWRMVNALERCGVTCREEIQFLTLDKLLSAGGASQRTLRALYELAMEAHPTAEITRELGELLDRLGEGPLNTANELERLRGRK